MIVKIVNAIKDIFEETLSLRKILMPVVGLIFFLQPCHSQDNSVVVYDSTYMAEIESLMVQAEKEQKVRDVWDEFEKGMLKHEMSFHLDGVGELLRGGIDSWRRKGFYQNETTWPQRGNSYIDYGLAFSPLAATWGLKMLGVESRSTTKRMIAANSLALGLSVGVSSIWKRSVEEPRPNKSGIHGMPSRHSAVAFSCATILHREYGHISPFISVGAYSAATMTEIMRLHNNDHWVKDVYVGAGIGTVATNLSYFLVDKMMGKKGVNKPKLTMADMQRVLKYNMQPTSLSLVSGIESGSNHDGTDFYGTTITAGMEYSYFFDSHLAIEGMGRYATTQGYDENEPSVGYNIDMAHFDLGTKYSWLLAPDTRFGCRAFAGTRLLFTTKQAAKNECCAECGIGGSLNLINKEKYAAGVNFDYVHAFSSKMTDRLVINAVWQIIL